MQAELWTLNGLAVELGRDRRSLARDLEGLEPDKVERKGGRTERRYRLKRVVEHLYRSQPGSPVEDFDNQRERLAAAQAEKVEMENAVRAGQLVEANKVMAAWADHVAAARSKLLGTPTKIGPMATNIKDPNVIATIVRTEIYAAINELADWEPPEPDGKPGAPAASDAGDVEKPAAADGQRVGRRKQKAEQRVIG